MQSAPPSICTMQNWYFLPNTSFARSETTVTKTALETLPVFLSDPNSAEPKPDQKVTDKFVQNQNSKHRKCLTFSDRRRQNCNRLPNSSFGRAEIEIGCMLHHANSAERIVHHAELKPFTQYQFCTSENDRDKNCIGKRSCLSLRSKQRQSKKRPKTADKNFRFKQK